MGKFKVCFIKDRNFIQQNLEGEFVKKKQFKKATRVWQLNSFSAQRWKLDDDKLLINKAEFWESDKWTFKTRNDVSINIVNTRQTKGLRATSNGSVIEEFFIRDHHRQLWKKGKPDAQDYFTLESSVKFGVPKVLTAISKTGLEVQGNISLRRILLAKCNERTDPLWKFCGDNSSLY